MASTSEILNVKEAKNMVLAPTDVYELPNLYVYTVDAPGIKSGDIKIEVEDENVLVISGKRKKEQKGGTFIKTERHMGKFTRKFNLPENAKTDKITASYRDGVLMVKIEKALLQEQKKPTATIDVERLSSSPVEGKYPNTIEVKVNCCNII